MQPDNLRLSPPLQYGQASDRLNQGEPRIGEDVLPREADAALVVAPDRIVHRHYPARQRRPGAPLRLQRLERVLGIDEDEVERRRADAGIGRGADTGRPKPDERPVASPRNLTLRHDLLVADAEPSDGKWIDGEEHAVARHRLAKRPGRSSLPDPDFREA